MKQSVAGNVCSRNQSIDLVKIYAMIGVMALHSTLDSTDTVVGFCLSRIAGISVPLFFMVSGYLLSVKRFTWQYSVRKIKGILRFCFTMCFLYWILLDLVKGSWPTEVVWDFLGCFFQHGHMWMFWYFGAMIIIYPLLPFCGAILIEKRTTLYLLLVVSIMFGMNVYFGLEEKYICQTFRLWNWLFYFSLGALLRKVQNDRTQNVILSGGAFLLSMLLFVAFSWLLKDRVSGIEYFFGSALLVLYAVCAFCFMSGLRISGSKTIASLSSLFLPVYALHWELWTVVRRVDVSMFGEMAPLAGFLLLSIVTIIFSWTLMKIPFINKIFKI